MIVLNSQTIASMPDHVIVPAYDRKKLSPGIVHFGVGNFHRAHQAYFIDALLAKCNQPDWGIIGVELFSNERFEQRALDFATQNCLYTLTQSDPHGQFQTRVIGALLDYILAPNEPKRVLDILANPAIRLVTMTITEGGYPVDLANHLLRRDHPGIQSDISGQGDPQTVFGFLVRALARRKADKIRPFTIMSCDNLHHNGDVARAAVTGLAQAIDPKLARWINDKVSFPNTLVDRITPAITPERCQQINHTSGVADKIPIVTESYCQWVIEDQFCHDRPALESVGVQISQDVAQWEQAKVRILNAGHSTLAYPGLLLGYQTVAQAIADSQIAQFVNQFFQIYVLPQLDAPTQLDVNQYQQTIMDRFANPILEDQLIRIASDGAAKIPIFFGTTIHQAMEKSLPPDCLAFILAAWSRVLSGQDEQGRPFAILEPLLTPEDRQQLCVAPASTALQIPPLKTLQLTKQSAFVAAFSHYRTELAERGIRATLNKLMS